MYANETIETLRLIKANTTAQILESAIAFFPNGQVPIDHDSREEVVNNIKEIAHEKWGELDEQFFKYEDDLNKLNLEFVKNNKTYF